MFLEADVLVFIAVGFFAQLVDGALGMAFGVISSTLLLSLGVSPTAASAGVHTVESSRRRLLRSATSPTGMSIGGCSGGSSYPA